MTLFFSLFLVFNPITWIQDWAGEQNQKALMLLCEDYPQTPSGFLAQDVSLLPELELLEQSLADYPNVQAWLADTETQFLFLNTNLPLWMEAAKPHLVLRGLGLNLDGDSTYTGLYLPKSQMALIQVDDNTRWVGTFWHELGHGLRQTISQETFQAFESLVEQNPTALRRLHAPFWQAYDAEEVFAEIVSTLVLGEASRAFYAHEQVQWVQAALSDYLN